MNSGERARKMQNDHNRFDQTNETNKHAEFHTELDAHAHACSSTQSTEQQNRTNPTEIAQKQRISVFVLDRIPAAKDRLRSENVGDSVVVQQQHVCACCLTYYV